MRKILFLIISISCAYAVLLVYENLTDQPSANEVEQLPAKSVDDMLDQNREKVDLNKSKSSILSQNQDLQHKEFNNKFAYVLNSNSTTISKCNINEVSGQLEHCSKTGRGFNAPTGVAVSKDRSWMYVTNNGENNVSICQIESRFGELENCHPTNAGEFNKPTGITLDELNSTAYITNVGNDSISRCDVNPSNMELVNCIQYYNDYLHHPSDIKSGLNNSDLFVVNVGSDSLVKCVFDDNKKELNCTKVLDGLHEPEAVFFTKNNVYIPNLASRLITICSSKLREKQLTDCTNLSGDFASMTDIFIDEGQNKIYITDEQKVSLCERNENRSMLKCQSTGDGFNSPSGIYVLGFL